MTVICPKCNYARKPTDSAPDYSCPSCGIVYAKFDAKADLEMRLERAMKTGNWFGVPIEHIPEQIRAQVMAREAARREAAIKQQQEALRQQEQQAAKQQQEALRQQEQQAAQQQEMARKTLLLTTTHAVPGREITGVLDVVSAECAYGMSIFKDVFAGLTDVIGGRSGSTQGVLRDARRTVMNELRTEAFNIGADAVVGVDLDYSEFSGGGKSMLFVVATGTAVKLAPQC